MLTFTGSADTAKRMAPHWQPPVRMGFAAEVMLLRQPVSFLQDS